jgi:hypothetical protein
MRATLTKYPVGETERGREREKGVGVGIGAEVFCIHFSSIMFY